MSEINIERVRPIIKPNRKPILKRKYKRIIITIAIFFLLVGLYKASGLQPITGYSILPLTENQTTESAVNQTQIMLEIQPQSINLQGYPNSRITQNIILENKGTVFLKPTFSVYGKISDWLSPINEIKLKPGDRKNLDLEFNLPNNYPKTYTGTIYLKYSAKSTEIPINIEILNQEPGGGGGSGQEPYTLPTTLEGCFKFSKSVIELSTNSTQLNLDLTLENNCDKDMENISLFAENIPGELFFEKPIHLKQGESKIIPVNLSLNESAWGVFDGKITANSSNHFAQINTKLYLKVNKITGAVYYNRSYYNIDSYELVPVPNAKIRIFKDDIELNLSGKTGTAGTFEIYTPITELDLYIIGHGFLVDENAHRRINSTSPKTIQFFLNIGKAKITLHNHSRFIIGETSEVTLTSLVKEQETVLEGFKGLNPVLELRLIKEVNEEIYPLTKPNFVELNLSEGTTYITTNLTLYDNLPSRDLNLPELQAKLLTSTNDVISEYRKYTNIGFLSLKSNLTHDPDNLGSMTLYNPTNRKIQGIILTSNIKNEFKETLDLSFSKNNFELNSKSSASIEPLTENPSPGHYSGYILISGTLPPVAGWDEYASDSVSIPVQVKVPGHDIAAYISAPIVTDTETKELNVTLENHGDFQEFATVQLTINNQTTTLGTTLEIGGTKTIQVPVSNIFLGTNNLILNATIQEDLNPNDNHQSSKIYIAENPEPVNLVMIILDGTGFEYLSRELTPNIFTLQYRGFSSQNTRAIISSTTESHSVLFTSNYEQDWDWSAIMQLVSVPNASVFDSMHSRDYLVLGVMGQGDTKQVVNEMNAILWDSDNDWENLDSDLNISEEVPSDLEEVFQAYNNLSEYQDLPGLIYVNYDQWTTDSLNGILENLAENHSEEKFFLVSNFAGTDHGGHAGSAEYKETLSAADLQVNEILDTLFKTGLIQNTTLIITADHGMCFRTGTYGEYGYHSSCIKPIVYKVPFIMLGPETSSKLSNSPAYNDDVSITLAELFDLPEPIKTTGNVRKEILTKIMDIGIANMETQNFLVGRNATTIVNIKNYGSIESSNELCLEVSDHFDLIYNECRSIDLVPDSETQENFTWQVPKSANYKIVSYLTDKDDNPDDKLLVYKQSVGITHDLGVNEIEPDKSETGKLKAKVVLKNLGDYDEEEIDLYCFKLNLDTGDFTEYIYINKSLKTGSKKTFGPWSCGDSKATTGFYNITFQILNYTNFDSDADPENNIKTLITYVN